MKLILNIFLFLFFSTLMSHAQSIDPSLVGQWTLDEGTGVTANDTTSNSNNATITNGTWTTGKIGSGALQFNGAGNVQIKSSSVFSGMKALTIALWVKLDQKGAATILDKRHNATPWYSYTLAIDANNRLSFQVVNTAQASATAGSDMSLQVGEWYHIVALYDGKKVSIYINGQQNGYSNSQAGGVFSSTGTLYINNGSKLRGTIDDVRIYNRGLSENEIQLLFNPSFKPAASQVIQFSMPPANNVTSPGEVCDGSDLNGLTCSSVSAGFSGGTLKCKTDRKGYDVSGCIAGNTINVVDSQNQPSCESIDVQRAINIARDGDTVVLPAKSCIWTVPAKCAGLTGSNSCPSVSIMNKNIVLKGSGQDKTIITTQLGDINYDKMAIYVQLAIGKPVRISNMSFIANTGSSIMGIFGTGKNFRVDNTTFSISSPTGTHGIFVSGYISGLIDHATFNITGHDQGVFFRNDAESWKRPNSFGKSEGLFIEDSLFNRDTNSSNYAGAFDGDTGTRLVFRYNTTINSTIFYHGPEVVGYRGGYSLEIYNNNLKSVGYTMFNQIGFWSGTGVAFNNTMTGSISVPLMVQYRRSCDPFPVYGKCDGFSSFDGNQDASGYPCLDQPGRSTDSDASSLQPQTADPIYEWNNTINDKDVDTVVSPAYNSCPIMSQAIQKDRDFINNTPRPGYVPYPYPHPLVLMDNPSSSSKNSSLGDVSLDGKVTMYDSALLFRYTVGSILTDNQKLNADINNDGRIDANDIPVITKKALGL